ncbi:MAG: helix-turn-helix domain-containing protein [Candidatus Heimdallarchaeaceae archaeon]
MKELQELGTPFTCRGIFYERIYFKFNECGKIFMIEHSFIPINAKYIPSVVKYAVSRLLDKGDSVRRVAQDLNELHLVKVSVSTVQRWVNEEGKRNELLVDFSDEKPPENFSGFFSLDDTFKLVRLKKTLRNW